MSLYNRLTQRDAPVAAPNPNMTPITSKPMSLRDAVQKYARGGNTLENTSTSVINPRAPAATKKPIGIDALGDSTTYGWNHGKQSANNMVSTAQNLFGDAATINNMGVPSTTVGDLLSSDNFNNVLKNNNPVVILNYGMNEAYRGEDPETFRANLMNAIAQLQSAGKKVILQTPNKPNSSDGWEGSVGNYANIISDVGRQTNSAVDDKYSTPVTYAEDDTIHPDEAGYGVLGQNLYSTINSVLNPSVNSAQAQTNVQPAVQPVVQPTIQPIVQPNAQSGTNLGQAPVAPPMTVESLYQNILGRASDPEGLAYWQQQFGNEVDPNEADIFRGTAQNLVNQDPNQYANLAPNLTPVQQPVAPAPRFSLEDQQQDYTQNYDYGFARGGVTPMAGGNQPASTNLINSFINSSTQRANPNSLDALISMLNQRNQR
jgi:lysophospholipase L1-like esterase